MNRSALVIKMLQYLKANNVVSREELASYLETNVRNISEFKKELEFAGYIVDTVRGKDGGYRLVETAIIPTLLLKEDEVKALNDASHFLKQAKFHSFPLFEEALTKIRCTTENPLESNQIHYLFTPQSKTYLMEQLFMDAKQKQHGISFEYRSLHEIEYKQRFVHPYELVYSEEGNYVVGYDYSINKSRQFKVFKISSYRMRNVEISTQYFERDISFKLSDYIGKQSILKDSYEVQLKIKGVYATLLLEREIGTMAIKNKVDDILYLTFCMENKNKIIEFILSLGKDCYIIAPVALREEIVQILEDTVKQYML